jgi:hypothetical protein
MGAPFPMGGALPQKSPKVRRTDGVMKLSRKGQGCGARGDDLCEDVGVVEGFGEEEACEDEARVCGGRGM